MGLRVFKSIAEAEYYGFEVFDTVAGGYLVRAMTEGGWAMALVAPEGDPKFTELQDSVQLQHVSDVDEQC